MPRNRWRRKNICVVPAWWTEQDFQTEGCVIRGQNGKTQNHWHASEEQIVGLHLLAMCDSLVIAGRRVLRLKQVRCPLRSGVSGHPSPPVPMRRGLLAAKGTKRALPTVRVRAPKKLGVSTYERFLEALVRSETWAVEIANSWKERK